MRSVVVPLLLLIGVLAAAGIVRAQLPESPDEAPPPAEAPTDPAPPDRPLADPEMRELIETVRMVHLSRQLGLDSEETVVMVRLFDRAREHAAQLNRERHDEMARLKEALRTDAAEERVQAALDRLIDLDKEIAGLRQRAFEEAGKNLDTRRRARLYILIHEFDADMRRLVDTVRQGRGLERLRQMRERREHANPPNAPAH